MRFWSPFPVDGWRELLKQFRRLLSLRDNMLGSLYLTVQAMIHKGKYFRYACLSEIVLCPTTWLYFLRRGTISFISKKVLAILFSFSRESMCLYIEKISRHFMKQNFFWRRKRTIYPELPQWNLIQLIINNTRYLFYPQKNLWYVYKLKPFSYWN